jgi:hypothetical protein
MMHCLAIVWTCSVATEGFASIKPSPQPQKDISSQKPSSERLLKAKGTIRDAGAPQEAPMFHIEYEHAEKNRLPHYTLIRQTDLAGNLLVKEDTQYDHQGKLKTYTLVQFQEDVRATVEVESSKVFLSWTEKGKTKTAIDTASQNMVAAGSLMAYMSAHIAHLTQGNNLDIRLAVPEHASVFGFTLIPQKSSCNSAPQDFCVDLSMSNFFLKKLVKPVRLTFQKSNDGYRPLSLVTPALVRKKKGEKLEKFTALIEYPRL